MRISRQLIHKALNFRHLSKSDIIKTQNFKLQLITSANFFRTRVYNPQSKYFTSVPVKCYFPFYNFLAHLQNFVFWSDLLEKWKREIKSFLSFPIEVSMSWFKIHFKISFLILKLPITVLKLCSYQFDQLPSPFWVYLWATKIFV